MGNVLEHTVVCSSGYSCWSGAVTAVRSTIMGCVFVVVSIVGVIQFLLDNVRPSR